MKRIIVRKNPRKYAIVDDNLYQKLAMFKWHLGGGDNTGYYAIRSGRITEKQSVYMHREVLGAKSGQIVDHINGNRLDNRTRNLRFVTATQNLLNTKLRKDNKYGCKGLRWREDVKSWRVNVKIQGKEIQIGYFKKKRDAIKARKQAERGYYGEYAR